MKACIFCGKVSNKNSDLKTNIYKLGANTGNMCFWHSLGSTLEADMKTVGECVGESFRASNYSSFVTTELIWIRENIDFPTVEQQLKIVGDAPLVPISVGLQCWKKKKNFSLHPNTVKILSRIQERCVLGVRGEYTADVLNSYGIKNLKVIGCPSMYYSFDYNFKIRKSDAEIRKVSMNMRAMYSELKPEEVAFLEYGADRNYTFVEQTEQAFLPSICKDPVKFEKIAKWFNLNKRFFLDINDWISCISEMDFSLGCRFHGNIVSLWNRIPALFIVIDSRTMELCEHFSLPMISLTDFDPKKDIRYYYDLADYTEFNKIYPKRLDEYIDFLKSNHLPIKKNCDAYYDRKIAQLQDKIQKIIK